MPRDGVIKGLQNEFEVEKQSTKKLDEKVAVEKVAIYSGILNNLKADKANLRNQLELATLTFR